MPRPNKRSALRSLTKPSLQSLVEHFGVEISPHSASAKLLDALARARSVTLPALFEQLSRDELKQVCRDHQIDDSGRAAANSMHIGLLMPTLLTPRKPRQEHGNLLRMRTRYSVLAALFLCIPLSALGCDRNGNSDAAGSSSGDGDSGDPVAACELTSTVELADADAVAPNGRTGSEILAAIPESFQTTLHWDLSTSYVEVQVQGASGQSSALNLTFTLPAVPEFYFEDRTSTSGETICDDYVKTTLDVKAETQDGALLLDITAVEVRLGPDHPEIQYWAKPFVLDTRPLTSPVVEFVSPVAQPADSEKKVAISFDDPEVTGDITAYATSSSETYQIVVAQW